MVMCKLSKICITQYLNNKTEVSESSESESEIWLSSDEIVRSFLSLPL